MVNQKLKAVLFFIEQTLGIVGIFEKRLPITEADSELQPMFFNALPNSAKSYVDGYAISNEPPFKF